MNHTPIVTIVGRPNVGKSTLFNRFIGERRALVHDMPGVTRDRNYGDADWYGRRFVVVDTGGFDPTSDEGMLPLMREQAQLAVDEATVILFVLDGREGLTDVDREVFEVLRRRRTDVSLFVAINKIDGKRQMPDALEFHGLGVETVWPISAEHGFGTADLIEAITLVLPETPEEEDPRGRIRVAVIGRPNAGKSTLINRLLGAERLIASPVPGTTRDAIDTDLDLTGEDGVLRRYTLIDTAGIRRKRSIAHTVEKFGVVKAMQSVERCHVAILLVDATDGFTDQDARVANLAIEQGRALIVAMNKWDAVEKDHKTADQRTKKFRESMVSMDFAPILYLSALTGQRASKLLELVDQVHAAWRHRIPTGELNRFFDEVTRSRPHPMYKGLSVKLYFITQVRVGPPTFVVVTNRADGISSSYERFLVNQLRERFGFEGTTIRLAFRQKGKKEDAEAHVP